MSNGAVKFSDPENPHFVAEILRGFDQIPMEKS